MSPSHDWRAVKMREVRCNACHAILLVSKGKGYVAPLCPGRHTEVKRWRGELRQVGVREEYIATRFHQTGMFGAVDVPVMFEKRDVPILGRDVIEMWWDQTTGERMAKVVATE